MKAATGSARPRRHYKELYEQAHVCLRKTRQERAVLLDELERLRGVLASHAEKETIPEIEGFLRDYPLADAIPVYPVSYEAIRAALRKSMPITEDTIEQLEVNEGLVNLSWRGKKLICQP